MINAALIKIVIHGIQLLSRGGFALEWAGQWDVDGRGSTVERIVAFTARLVGCTGSGGGANLGPIGACW
jgi:hypothetical protein